MGKGAAHREGCCEPPYRFKHKKPASQYGVQEIKEPTLRIGRQLFPEFNWDRARYLCLKCRTQMLADHANLRLLRAGVQQYRLHQEISARHVQNPANIEPQIDTVQSAMDDAVSSSSSVEASSRQKAVRVELGENEEFQSSAKMGEDDPYSLPPRYEDVETISPARNNSNFLRVRREEHSIQGPSRNLYPSLSGIETPHQPATPLPTPASSVVSSLPLPSSQASKASTDSGSIAEIEKTNLSLKAVDVSPLRPSDTFKPSILRRKYTQMKASIKSRISRLSKTNINPSPHTCKRRRCAYCEALLQQLAAKYRTLTTRTEKYKCLTSIPRRFTIEQVINATGCTVYMAREASKLRRQFGAFYSPPLREGKRLPDETVQAIRDFYRSSDHSHISPTTREVVFVTNDDGTRTQEAKKRIIHNLNDLYSVYCKRFKENPDRLVSISKFAMLRPKDCVWPGKNRQHVVCVCEIHENFKFLLEALDWKLGVAEFISQIVCDNDNESCYLNLCNNCPKLELCQRLYESLDGDEEVTYIQWTHTDGTDIKEITVPLDDFKRTFEAYIPKITEHEFINVRQTAYHDRLKNHVLKEEAAITVQVDYAQNYSFVVQNAVQGFHWTNRQATVHPFLVHWFDTEAEKLLYKSYCVISDEMSHDADTFDAFRKKVIPLIKDDFSNRNMALEKVYYISDGAGGQYKNMKNFSNLMKHKEEYNLDAEWSFTATSHGKSTCDAISAVVKCWTRRQSLTPGVRITTPQAMFNHCVQHLTKSTLQFVWVSKEDVESGRAALAERYKQYKKLDGSRKHHIFQPRSDNIIRMVRASDTAAFVDVNFKAGEVTDINEATATIGSFYAFMEAGNYHIGLLMEANAEEGDTTVQIMKITSRRNGTLEWPEPLQLIHVAYRDFLIGLDDPTSQDDIVYNISRETLNLIRSATRKYKSNKTN